MRRRQGRLRVREYVDRLEFITSRCVGRRVLDVGVVGETCRSSEERIEAFPSSLHVRIAAVARELVGVDHSEEEVWALERRHPDLRLVFGDVESLAELLRGEESFETVVAGDIIEHLSNPGRSLDAIRRVMRPDGELVLSCPNGFGLPNYIRFLTGRYTEGDDHVHAHTKYTLDNLLRRHGLRISEVRTALDWIPNQRLKRSVYVAGTKVLRVIPELGGTLVVTAAQASGFDN